jgi:sialate O-acetylesterase
LFCKGGLPNGFPGDILPAMNLRFTLFAVFSFAATALHAELRLPGFFSDHMVFQRDALIPVWGWAKPGEEVTAQLGPDAAAVVKVKADEAGRWEAKLPASPANATGLEFRASAGGKTITLKDVLVGEVWLCSGQSNMEWSVSASLNPAEEIAAANFPAIRQMKIDHLTAATPQADVRSVWQVCSPATAGQFTAAGYFMARDLHRELGVPIGLLNSSWGGTRIEPWTPVEGFSKIPALAAIQAQVVNTLPDSERYQTSLRAHLEAVAKWQEAAAKALADKTAAPVTPVFPTALLPLTAHTAPTTLYNAMINPLVGYGMRGAIWYQGESNHAEPLYPEKKNALVAGWREKWGLGEFPFYFVQIAPWHYGNEDPAILPRFWEAQSACLAIPKTGMVVTNDIGDIKDIHPKNKQEVGRRLALLALKNDYGKTETVASGPVFRELVVEPGRLLVKFDNVADGLKSRDGKPLTHFEIIGETAEFVPATATIEGTDTVVLAADGVKEPVAMRYAWHKLAEPNLANGAGLPSSAFRAGTVPDYDFFALKVPEAAEYELVYDLDLKTLGADINYAVDRSGEIAGAFDRVGYFMELLPSGGGRQWVWTSMDAFTTEAKKLGVPTVKSGIIHQAALKNLKVLSNVEVLSNGDGLEGQIEFWPHNYGPMNTAKVPGASDEIWDFGDAPMAPPEGYGSMQIHQIGAKQTVFSVNQWRGGQGADLGIGNSSKDPKSLDWTFSANAGTFESARIRVFVRVKK